MTPEQYAANRAMISENALRACMALLGSAFPHLKRDIDTIGHAWDAALDSLDSSCAWENAATNTNQPEGAGESE